MVLKHMKHTCGSTHLCRRETMGWEKRWIMQGKVNQVSTLKITRTNCLTVRERANTEIKKNSGNTDLDFEMVPKATQGFLYVDNHEYGYKWECIHT